MIYTIVVPERVGRGSFTNLHTLVRSLHIHTVANTFIHQILHDYTYAGIDTRTHTHTHTQTYSLTHIRAHTHTQMRTQTHLSHTHTHKATQPVIFICMHVYR
jgi:hypothetical protein